MKRLITILLALIMVISLCACGSSDNPSMSQNNPSTSPTSNEKGKISNPYSINDIIEFVGCKVESQDYLSGKRTVYDPSTFRLTNMKVHDEVEFESDEPDSLFKLVTFTLEIVDSSIDTPIDLMLDYSIQFVNINDKGIEGGMAWLPNDLHESMNINEFQDLRLLPGFSTKCGTILYNSDGGNLSLISLCYFNEAGELAYIYIDPFK